MHAHQWSTTGRSIELDAASNRDTGSRQNGSRRRELQHVTMGSADAEYSIPWEEQQSEVVVMAGLARASSMPISSGAGQMKKAMQRALLASRKSAGSWRHSMARKILWWTTCFILVSSVGSWIALSKTGYSMKHSLLAQAGVRVTGDINVNGLLLSAPVADLQCNPSRKGALRWNDRAFEGCDGETDWRPLTFCSRTCSIDTKTVPCGVQIRNKCDGDCNQEGTGLNMRQCILAVADTSCDAPVQDLCGNECGLAGEGGCSDSIKAVGDYTIRPTGGLSQSSATYTFSVAKQGRIDEEPDDGFYLTFTNTRTSEQFDLTRLSHLDEEEEDGSTPMRSKPYGLLTGMEMGNPEPGTESALRVSMFTELVGGYVKVGQDFESEAPSHIFIDGTIEKECPFLFNAGNYDSPLFLKVCLEAPEGNVSITLPDAGGVVITTGNEEDIRSLPGLRGENSLVFNSNNKDKFHLRPPNVSPRVSCSRVQCLDSPLVDVRNTQLAGCNELDLVQGPFDLFRIIYGLIDVGDDSSNISASNRVREILTNASRANLTRLELANVYAMEQVAEQGNQSDPLFRLWNGLLEDFEFSYQEERFEIVSTFNANWSNWTNYTVPYLVTLHVNTTQFAVDYLREREECFACCCAELAGEGNGSPFRDDPEGLDPAALGRCPGQRRTRPTFCISGEALGAVCSGDEDCAGGGACGYDEDVYACWEEDLGFRCQAVWDRANLTTALNFESPLAYQRLHIPDASGSIISTGNLAEITSMGVQDSPIVAHSGPSSTTTIAFMPPHDSELRQRRGSAVNNTLLIPNEKDGILLSTANLDDVTLESGSMSGLRVLEDVHVRGSLIFGDDVTSSGFYLDPLPSSVEYSTPHSGRPSPRGRPGQLAFRVDESTTVLEFEPSDVLAGVTTTEILLPATNGTIITTGNLEAVTAQSGVITSLDVMELSHLQGGIVAGVKGDAQVHLQGRASHTVVFNASHPRGRGEEGFSNTVLGFEMVDGTDADTVLPQASGVVITTGNLPDVFAFTGDLIDVSGRSLFHGPVSLGTRVDGFPATPIKVKGYLAGDIVYRDVPEESDALANVPYPNTWNVQPNAVCSGLFSSTSGLGTSSDTQTTIPYEHITPSSSVTYYERALSVPGGIPPFGTGCREICENTPSCGAIVASKYFRVSLFSSASALEETESVVGVSIPEPRVENGLVVGDATCFPGYAADENATVAFAEGFLHNFSTYPASRLYFLQNPACQAVVGVTEASQRPLWEDDWFKLGQLEMRMVSCTEACSDCDGGACAGLGDCARADAKCAVTIRSHAVGSYLTGSNETGCLSAGAGGGCARWSQSPAVWHLEPYDGEEDLRWHEMGAEAEQAHYYRLRRGAVCAEVQPALTTSAEVFVELDCGPGDRLLEVTSRWGGITGACGAYGGAGDTECVGPDDLIAETCLPFGCDLRIHGRRLYVRAKRGDGAWRSEVLRQCVSTQRLVLQGRCQASPYLAASPQLGGELQMVPAQAAAAGGLSTVFHLHSRLLLSNGEEQVLRGGFLRDCWITEVPAQECRAVQHNEFDVHYFGRYTATKLAFANMSSEQTQTFPDTSGNIISSGNLRDITRLTGLQNQDMFIYQHSHQPGGPVTIVDVAEIGHASQDRVEGDLPQYVRDDGSPGHTVPENGNRRITFPDATGTVITTGNLDDLVFQRLELNGLSLDGTANFFNELGQTAVLNFRNSSRISGCLNFNRRPERNEQTGGLDIDMFFTQVCVEEPTGVNKINLPDASGTILTTGNLLNLPTMGVQGEFFIGGDATIEGDMTWGQDGVDAVVSQYSWIDGDVGITFAAPQSTENEGFDVLKLNMPHMGGVDIAIRHYLTYDVRELAVDVQGGEAYLQSVAGTERINETVCEAVMSSNQVYDYHGLGYFLLQNELIAKTLIRDGVPYWGVDVKGNQTYPACLFIETGQQVCEGPSPDPCLCPPPREAMAVRWRPASIQVVLGEQNASQCDSVACDDSPFTCTSPGDPGCAFDGNVSTAFRSEEESLNSTVPFVDVEPAVQSFSAYGTNLRPDGLPAQGQCVLGLRLARAQEITRVRVYPAPGGAAAMVGGRIQGAVDEAGSEWVDILLFTAPPREAEWNEILVRGLDGVRFRSVRYVGPACTAGSGCRCDVAELEFHQGRVTQRFTALETGTRSHYIVSEAVNEHPAGAMVLKCAAQRWFPAYQTMHVNELMLPEASGVLLTTGNLEDVTKEVGTISSLKVGGQAEIRGSTVLGSAQEDTLLKIEATTMGRTPLSFAGGGVVDAAAFFSLTDVSSDRTVFFPPDSGGTIVTTGSLPQITEHVSVVGEASLRGNIQMDNSVTIGDKLSPSSLLLSSTLETPFPMTFRPQSVTANEKTTLGVENPSEARTLNLPDVEGTIITTGNLPDVLESPLFVGDTIFRGGAKFEGQDIAFGKPGARINLEINSAIGGSQPLRFEGRTNDERTLSLAVEEPSGQNILFLPDVSGTIITTGNFPDVVESLEVLGDLLLEGETSIVGKSTIIGHCQLKSQLSVHSYLQGRYPLMFSPVGPDGGGEEFVSTTFEITPPTSDNVIAFPDASGTVITTGNIPNSVSVDFEYSITVGRFLGIASSVTFGKGASEPKHAGSFVFADASTPLSNEPFSSTRQNSFNVRATGGVRFVTGYTTSGRELGVVLEPGSSAWSVLSDEHSKVILEALDHKQTLEKLVGRIPISTWSYEGDSVRHMGPMAQDVYEAFRTGESETRLSSVDVDGIALSAIKGMDAALDATARGLESLRQQAVTTQLRYEEVLSSESALDRRLDDSDDLLDRLERMLVGGVE